MCMSAHFYLFFLCLVALLCTVSCARRTAGVVREHVALFHIIITNYESGTCLQEGNLSILPLP